MSELSFEELDRTIREICIGEKVIVVEDSSEEEQLVVLRHPTPREIEISQRVYDKALLQGKKDGLLSIEEMQGLIESRNLFTKEDQNRLDSLQSKLDAQQLLLQKTTRVPARRDRIKNIIKDIEQEISDLSYKREKVFEFTRERKAYEEKYLFLTQKCALNPDTLDLYWKTLESFQNEEDFIFRRRVFVEFIIFSHGLSTGTVRFISRSNLWRVKYVTSLKTGDPLFGRPIADYSVDQQVLLHWSHYYQSIYEMMPDERPEDTIIEDDAALDAYMKDWHDQKSRDRIGSKSKKKYGKSTAWDHQETIVTQSHELFDDIEYSKPKNSRGTVSDAAPIGRDAKKQARKR